MILRRLLLFFSFCLLFMASRSQDKIPTDLSPYLGGYHVKIYLPPAAKVTEIKHPSHISCKISIGKIVCFCEIRSGDPFFRKEELLRQKKLDVNKLAYQDEYSFVFRDSLAKKEFYGFYLVKNLGRKKYAEFWLEAQGMQELSAMDATKLLLDLQGK